MNKAPKRKMFRTRALINGFGVISVNASGGALEGFTPALVFRL